jgi:large conductance mechanosensitive channel
MLRDFKTFLTKDNFVALAIAVVLGGAIGKVVQAIVDDFIMPIVGAVTPSGDWQKATLDVGSVSFGIGDFISVLINFIIIAFVVWRVAKLIEKPASPPIPVKACPFCKMEMNQTATRCPHCTSQL